VRAQVSVGGRNAYHPINPPTATVTRPGNKPVRRALWGFDVSAA
jgi:hypothetical protein